MTGKHAQTAISLKTHRYSFSIRPDRSVEHKNHTMVQAPKDSWSVIQITSVGSDCQCWIRTRSILTARRILQILHFPFPDLIRLEQGGSALLLLRHDNEKHFPHILHAHSTFSIKFLFMAEVLAESQEKLRFGMFAVHVGPDADLEIILSCRVPWNPFGRLRLFSSAANYVNPCHQSAYGLPSRQTSQAL